MGFWGLRLPIGMHRETSALYRGSRCVRAWGVGIGVSGFRVPYRDM